MKAPDTIIVAGSGKSLMTLGHGGPVGEFWDALALAPDAHIMAVNFTVCFIPRWVQHLASLHHLEVEGFRAARRGLDYCYAWGQPETHCNQPGPGVDRVWDEFNNEDGRSGTSALFAVKVALALGYTRVIVAGVPLDNGGRFYDPANLPSTAHGQYDLPNMKTAWVRARDEVFSGRVTSMGGYTAEVLGTPTKEA